MEGWSMIRLARIHWAGTGGQQDCGSKKSAGETGVWGGENCKTVFPQERLGPRRVGEEGPSRKAMYE